MIARLSHLRTINETRLLQGFVVELASYRKMMMRAVSQARRLVASTTVRRFAADAEAASADLLINFCAPHETIYSKKAVESVLIPGADGEYGVTAGISPIISELQPGVVQVNHKGGESEKFFVSGKFFPSYFYLPLQYYTVTNGFSLLIISFILNSISLLFQ